MINQKAISLKIDVQTLEELDKEISLGQQKRNRLINEAIRMYIDAKDTRRRWRQYYRSEDKAQEYEQFLLRWFPHL